MKAFIIANKRGDFAPTYYTGANSYFGKIEEAKVYPSIRRVKLALRNLAGTRVGDSFDEMDRRYAVLTIDMVLGDTPITPSLLWEAI